MLCKWSRKSFIRSVISIEAIVTVTTIRKIIAMSNLSPLQNALETWIKILGIASLFAVSLTILFGGATLWLRERLSKLEKTEKQKLQLRIAKFNERAESAWTIAQEARAKQTIAELELERLRSSTEIVSKKMEQSEKIINTRVIDPIKMAEILSKKRDINISLSSITDIESQSLFRDLGKAFKLANWQIILYSPNTIEVIMTDNGITTPQGIIIEASNNELAQFLKTAFEYFKISCSIKILTRLPANQLDILIGAR